MLKICCIGTALDDLSQWLSFDALCRSVHVKCLLVASRCHKRRRRWRQTSVALLLRQWLKSWRKENTNRIRNRPQRNEWFACMAASFFCSHQPHADGGVIPHDGNRRQFNHENHY